MVEDLAREHQQELADAGTVVDLEELTCQIGDEVARQLRQHELFGRAKLAMSEEIAKCPECGEPCMAGEPEPTLLEGLRGELIYNQPSYYCRHCHRSVFPMAASLGLPTRSTVTPSILRKMVWAGSSLGSYPHRRNPARFGTIDTRMSNYGSPLRFGSLPELPRRRMFAQLTELLSRAPRPRILVVGDVMLDRYLWCDVDRISPEAPIPVLKVARQEHRLGGAGSVTAMLAALGAEVRLASVVGCDREGQIVRDLLEEIGVDGKTLLAAEDRETTVKERLLGRTHSRHPQQVSSWQQKVVCRWWPTLPLASTIRDTAAVPALLPTVARPPPRWIPRSPRPMKDWMPRDRCYDLASNRPWSRSTATA